MADELADLEDGPSLSEYFFLSHSIFPQSQSKKYTT
jgi:hypothetical protein